MERKNTTPNDRSAVIYWITGWRVLIIFTAFGLLSHTHNDDLGDVIHTAVLCVGMMTVVFGLTAYRFWPRLSFLFFLGTIAAHLGRIDFVAHPALANTHNLMAEFLMVSRLAIFEIVLAAFASFVGKSLTQAKHGPDGYIDDLDISKILTWRFLIALISWPVGPIVFLASASFFVGDFRWNDPVFLGELRDYTIGIIAFIPFGIGIAIYMTGGVWLEPRLRPVRRYVLLYVSAALLLNLVLAQTDLGNSAPQIEISFAILCAIGTIFPHAVLIGGLQLIATTSILLQYALWQHTDITAYFAIPALSLITIMMITLRTLSQVKMNTLVHQTQQQGELLNTFVRNGPHYFLVQDQDYKLIEISETFARDMFGATADEMIGHDVLDFRTWDPEGVERIRSARTKYTPALKDGDIVSQEYSTKTFDGKLLHLKANYIHTQTPTGDVHRYVVVQDRTDVVNANEKLRQQAYIDALTGLRNRLALLEDFSDAHFQGDNDYGLFMCRIDSLASIYEAYSIQVGDRYLTSLSAMLCNELGDNAAIYRLGGDVFLIAQPWERESHALEFAEKLQELVGDFRMEVDDHIVHQSITIGAAQLRSSGDMNTALNLCRRALDAARQAGESQIQIANEKFIRLLDAQGAFVTLRDVEDALDNGEFNYKLQPMIDLRTATIAGVDAKVHWQRASNAHISFNAYRDHFLEIVMKQSHDDSLTAMAQELLKAAVAAKTTRIYWHTRSRLLENNAIMHRITQGFGKHPTVSMALAFPAKSLLARTSRSTVVNNLHHLRDAGITVAIDAEHLDDINVLQIAQLPIDEIILSGTIIEDISSDRRMQDRVAPIVQLLRKFDIKIAAANVSTQSQLQTVAGLGIGFCSGDMFANAVGPNEYPSLVETLEIGPLISDTKNIVSFRDFTGH